MDVIPNKPVATQQQQGQHANTQYRSQGHNQRKGQAQPLAGALATATTVLCRLMLMLLTGAAVAVACTVWFASFRSSELGDELVRPGNQLAPICRPGAPPLKINLVWNVDPKHLPIYANAALGNKRATTDAGQLLQLGGAPSRICRLKVLL